MLDDDLDRDDDGGRDDDLDRDDEGVLDDDFDRDVDCLLDPGRVQDDLGLRDCPWEALGCKVPALPDISGHSSFQYNSPLGKLNSHIISQF